jgi:OOP family OmpA-OmpF porin
MKRTVIAAAAGLLLMGGCTTDIFAVKNAQGGPTPFDKALTEEYQAYVAKETSNYDWRYARYFAKKGLAAAHGQNVLPEDPAKWDISDKTKPQLVAAHQELISALDGGARQSKPAEAARAQARFDCWVQKQAEGNVPHLQTYDNDDGGQIDISNSDQYQGVPCKSGFNSALALIQKH